jgi:hypothetical protein
MLLVLLLLFRSKIYLSTRSESLIWGRLRKSTWRWIIFLLLLIDLVLSVFYRNGRSTSVLSLLLDKKGIVWCVFVFLCGREQLRAIILLCPLWASVVGEFVGIW